MGPTQDLWSGRRLQKRGFFRKMVQLPRVFCTINEHVQKCLACACGYPLAASIILIGIAWGLIGGGYDVLIGLYGTRVLRGGGGVAVGVLYAADDIGVLAGTAVAPRLPRRHLRGSYALAYGLQVKAPCGRSSRSAIT